MPISSSVNHITEKPIKPKTRNIPIKPWVLLQSTSPNVCRGILSYMA